jgi:DNA-binding LytR/AlgR family response regulator
MELKCIIVDDEPPAQRILEKYIADIPTLKLEAKCNDAFEAMEVLHSKSIDIIFLDINMPKMSGLSFIQTLKNPPLIIVTTAYREYAMDGFDLDVLDYLKKPISFERFVKAVNKAMDKYLPLATPPPAYVINETGRQQLDESFIFVKDDKITYRVDLKDIFYIEAVGDYAKIITTQKVYITCQTMKRFEACLPSNRFIRVHKSFIIAVSKINSIEGNLLSIGNTHIPIGATYRKAFFDLIDALNNSL